MRLCVKEGGDVPVCLRGFNKLVLKPFAGNGRKHCQMIANALNFFHDAKSVCKTARQYCTTRGYQVVKLVKEVGSGVNDSRPKLLSLLKDPMITRLVVEQKDRLTRFGFRYIETPLEVQGRTIEVVKPAENHKEDLLHDLASIVYSICAKLYRQRRAKRKAERLVEQ